MRDTTDDQIREFCKNKFNIDLMDCQVELIKQMSSTDKIYITMPRHSGYTYVKRLMNSIYGKKEGEFK